MSGPFGLFGRSDLIGGSEGVIWEASKSHHFVNTAKQPSYPNFQAGAVDPLVPLRSAPRVQQMIPTWGRRSITGAKTEECLRLGADILSERSLLRGHGRGVAGVARGASLVRVFLISGRRGRAAPVSALCTIQKVHNEVGRKGRI